jgi:hypothetical protein
MLKFKYIIILAVLAFILTGTQSFALVAKSGTAAGASPSQTKILKVAGVVSKIQGNVLYLESGNQYNLSGVKVSYSKGTPVSRTRKMAEMFFINGVLKEVTIR